MKLGVLTRTFELDHKYYFVPTILVLCDLGAERRLLPEVDLWRLSAAELGKEAILDECMPKQRGEFLVHGRCYTAGAVPRTAASVRAKVGSLDKSLYVIGDRVWRRDGVPGEATPFTEMPIRYTRAFGGEGYALNPTGIGVAPVKGEDGREVHPLPNIEHPKALVQSRSDRPAPAGFGPYELLWAQRWPKMGTYDRKWMREQLPGFAKDMDLTMWNAAPEDQQLPAGFFEGGEAIYLENLHPERPRLEGRLPGIVGRCFVTQRSAEGEAFHEIPMRLDTVQIFPHLERVALSFRGLWRVAEDDADDILHLLVACDDTAERRPLEHYREVLKRRLDPKREASEVFRDGDLVPPNIGGGGGGGDIDAMFELTRRENHLQKNLAERARREAEKVRAEVIAAGGDPSTVPDAEGPKVLSAPTFEELPGFVERSERELEEAQRKMDAAQEKLVADTRKRYAEAGRDYDAAVAKSKKEGAGPPKFSADKEMERLRDIQTLCQNANVATPDLDATLADPKTEARLRQAEEEAREAYLSGAHLAEYRPARLEEPARSELRRRVAEAHAAGRSLSRQDLSGADLSGMDLRGVDLTEAFLENAVLARANLAGARLSRAVLAGSDLTEVDLSGADLSEANLGASYARGARLDDVTLRGAVLSQADFTGASLHRVSFEKADLSDVVLDGASLTLSRFDKCILKGNQLRGCDLRESTFSHAILAEVDLRSANLAHVTLEHAALVRCTLDGASFLKADLRGIRLAEPCSFVGADLTGAMIDGATLRETDFSRADFTGASLNSSDMSKCVLREANLYRVVAKNVMLSRADLTGARLVAANLEGAVLLKAKLGRADFTGANLFRADLLRAVGDDRTCFTDANVTQVRVSPREGGGPGKPATVDPQAQQQAEQANAKKDQESAKKESHGQERPR
ncbi:DUF2169 family type VI secretion system accessory protein [Chondromyces crocatus]|uniref:DUF2169 domain-containing protein n=1 Tax=Chondromyces crocatus TaxID=52 RepID=A0A0K1EIE9_CHOCO|nr:DUF2169 domain-containing protein [Chondromyces crocatus]AKT40636.1 uncharacterized protein CMC5_047920 [Chondromyces crocatus]